MVTRRSRKTGEVVDQNAGSILNASGYLFQLRVEHEVKETQTTHGWRVKRHEHPWILRGADEEGFVDMVLECRERLLVVECKRPRKGDLWVFPIADGQPAGSTTGRVRCQYVKLEGGRFDGWWGDVLLLPPSPEAEFCVLHGKRDGPSLEAMAQKLLSALEAIAVKEVEDARLKMGSGSGADFQRLLIPVVVTSARLVVARIEVDKISLADGTVNSGAFEEVRLVRFRKNLAVELSPLQTRPWLDIERSETERTILVVNATGLSEVLKFLGQAPL